MRETGAVQMSTFARLAGLVSAMVLFSLPASAATKQWTGAVSDRWSASGNWTGGLPADGDALVFPAVAANQTNTNDLPAGSAFASMTITGGSYTIGGNLVALSNGILVQSTGASVNLPIRLTATQAFEFTHPSSTLGGAIDLDGHDLSIYGYVTVSGLISGNGNVTLTARFVDFNPLGVVRLTGNNTYSGATTVRAHASIDGSQPQSDVVVFGFESRLFGTTGVLGNLTANSLVAPGPANPCCVSDNGPGRLIAKNLSLASGSLYRADVSGPAPATGHDQLRAIGTVSIQGASLIVTLGPAYAPIVGSVIVLIDNDGVDPVVGAFFGYPEGAVLAFGTTLFRLSYAGGDGNDVTLTSIAPPSLAIGDVTLTEGSSGPTPFAFNVTLSPPAAATTTVNWATAPGTATAGSDYVTASGSVTFSIGQSLKTIGVTVNGDSSFELNETFLVRLSAPSGAVLADSEAVGTITNDDAMPSLAIDDVTLPEGNSGATTARFSVTLSSASGVQAAVFYSTANATASFTSDYVAASGLVVFAPGETAKSIAVTVNGDTLAEPDETFHVELSGASQAMIGDGEGVGTITNDDIPPSRVFASVLGLDSNDCSNTLTPCRTLNGALAQVATDGAVIVTKSGSYAGATITKGVKIDVASGVVAFSGQPIVVNPGPGGRVVIRGMTVKAVTAGTGTGIQHQSGDLFLERTVVDGWQVGVGSTTTGKLFVMDSTLRNNAGAGASVSAGEASVESSRLLGNGTGLEMLSGKATASASVLSGNGVGLSAGGGSDVSLEKSQVGSNAAAGVLVPAASLSTVRLNRCVVTGNGVGLQNDGGTIAVTGTNAIRGNTIETAGTITPAALQ
jgi:hypothetical protein